VRNLTLGLYLVLLGTFSLFTIGCAEHTPSTQAGVVQGDHDALWQTAHNHDHEHDHGDDQGNDQDHANQK
jgi:hypothetical protein